MSFSSKHPLRRAIWLGAVLALVFATLYPSDMDGHYATSRNGHENALVMGVETYGRHLNTLIPIGTAIVLRDVKGLWQMTAVVLAGTLATHGPKRLLNNVEIAGTRLGQRPNGGDHNMPSGHSALASAGAYIAVRRYLKWMGVIVWPILFLTMYARYMLDAHTVSATIAGAIVGVLVAHLLVKPCFRLRRLLHMHKLTAPRRKQTRAAPLVGQAS